MTRLGGHAYSLGTFISEGFAEAIAAPFRDWGLFSVVHRLEGEICNGAPPRTGGRGENSVPSPVARGYGFPIAEGHPGAIR